MLREPTALRVGATKSSRNRSKTGKGGGRSDGHNNAVDTVVTPWIRSIVRLTEAHGDDRDPAHQKQCGLANHFDCNEGGPQERVRL